MISPTENVSCSLPNRGSGRKEHTHDRSLICGGTPGAEGRVGMSAQKSTMRTSCLNLTSSATHILTHMRSRHSSWPVDGGIILMGGTPQDFSIRDSLYTTELVKFDGPKEEVGTNVWRLINNGLIIMLVMGLCLLVQVLNAIFSFGFGR